MKPWETCNDAFFNGFYSAQQEASQWLYPILKTYGVPILFYSGDIDIIVGTYGSRQWIKELDWPI